MTPLHLRSGLFDVEHEMQPEWLALPLDVTGAHRRLLVLASYLAEGGRIAGCKRWSVPQWYARVGFHRRLLSRLEGHELVRWEGDDLVVVHYIANHEKRIRGLVALALAMTATRVAKRRSTPEISTLELPGSRGPRRRVNCAKVLKTPTTVPFNGTVQRRRERTPDPGLAPRQPAPDSAVRSAPLFEALATSGPLRETTTICDRGADTGPDGFERWRTAMPVVRRPRAKNADRRWRDEELEYWSDEDLEPETEEILAHLERKKQSETWLRSPRFIPSPINFLRSAEWRPRPRCPPAIDVYEPTKWQSSARSRAELESVLKALAEGKSVS